MIMYEKAFIMNFCYAAVLARAETHSARKYKLDNPSLIAAYLL